MATVTEALAELKAVVVAEKQEVLAKITDLETKLADALAGIDAEAVAEIQTIIDDVKGIVTTPVVVPPIEEPVPVATTPDAPLVS